MPLRSVSKEPNGFFARLRSLHRSISRVAGVLVLLRLAAPMPAQISVVSAASYQPGIAPGSIATVFGSNLGAQMITGTPGADGTYPKQLGGITVTVGGAAADLFFVAPTQINFAVPPVAQYGSVDIVIASGAQTIATAMTTIFPTAPAIFTTDATGKGFGAILNAIDFTQPPFPLTTRMADGAPTTTIVAVYGTGFRFAGGATVSDHSGDVSSHVTAIASNPTGKTWTLPVLYAGSAPLYEGLDQINVQLTPDLDTTTDITLALFADAVPSNPVYLWLRRLPAPTITSVGPASASPGTTITISGTGFLGPTQYNASTREAVVFLLSDNRQFSAKINSFSNDNIQVVVPAPSVEGSSTFYAGSAQVCIVIDSQASCWPTPFVISPPPVTGLTVGAVLFAWEQDLVNHLEDNLPPGTDPVVVARVKAYARQRLANVQREIADAVAGHPDSIQVTDLQGSVRTVVLTVSAIQQIEALLAGSGLPPSGTSTVKRQLSNRHERATGMTNQAACGLAGETEEETLGVTFQGLALPGNLVSGIRGIADAIFNGCMQLLASKGLAALDHDCLNLASDAAVAEGQINEFLAPWDYASFAATLLTETQEPVFLRSLQVCAGPNACSPSSPSALTLSPTSPSQVITVVGNFVSPTLLYTADQVVAKLVSDYVTSPIVDAGRALAANGCQYASFGVVFLGVGVCDLLAVLDPSWVQQYNEYVNTVANYFGGKVTSLIQEGLAATSLPNVPQSVSVTLGARTLASADSPTYSSLQSIDVNLACKDGESSSVSLLGSTVAANGTLTFRADGSNVQSGSLLLFDSASIPTATLTVLVNNHNFLLKTDKQSYSLTDNAVITGTNFIPGTQLKLSIQGNNVNFVLIQAVSTFGNGSFQQIVKFPSSIVAGVYQIVAGSADDSQSASATITIQASPIAEFTMSGAGQTANSGGVLNLGLQPGRNVSVSLDGTGSSAGAGAIATWAWQDNGSPLPCSGPTCSYMIPSTTSNHTITLLLTNSGGQTASATGQVNITVQSSVPGAFTLTSSTPVCDQNPPAPSPAVRLDWTLSANASTYDIYRNGSLYSQAASGLTFYNSANVAAGQSYTYLVRARNSVGITDSNTITVSIPSNICQTAVTLVSVAISPTTVTGGGSATITVTLSGAAPSPTGAAVSLSSSNPSAFPPPPTLVVQPGKTTASATITAGSVSTGTTVTVTASYGGATATTTVTITPPGASLALSATSITPSSLSSGGLATLSVALNGTARAGGAVVNIQTSNSTAFPAPSSITIPAGESTNGVSIQAGAVTSATTVTVTATYGEATRTATVTVNPSAGNQVLVSPTSWQPQFTLGDSPATIGVRINSQTGAVLTGTITGNSSWLTANGHASYNWVAPETVNVTATPAGLSAGTYTGSLSVTAPAASNSPVSIAVTMTIVPPLQITTTSLPNATWGQAYTYQLQASGGTGYEWALQSGSSLPPNLSLSSSGLISGTLVQANSTNTYSFAVLVTDERSRTQYANLSLKVQAPIVVATNASGSFQFSVGQTYVQPPNGSNSISFFATGGTAPYGWTAASMPPGLRIDGASGYIIGTPTQAGSFSAAITATDATGRTGTGSFTLIVVITPLVIMSGSGQTPPTLPSGMVGVAYNQYLLAGGGSNAGYQWTVSGLPPGLSGQVNTSASCTSSCSFQIAGTPSQAGSYTVTVKVTDSLNNTATATIPMVINSGTPPTITTSTLNLATVGQSYSFSFVASGGTPPYQWSFASASPDPGLQLTSIGTLQGTSTVPNDCPTGPGIWVGNQPPFGTFTPSYFQVQVTDSASQSTNKQFCLPAYYPTPQIASLNPPSVSADGQTHTVTLNGSNFRNNDQIYNAGNGFANFISATALSFTLSPAPPSCTNLNPSYVFLLSTGACWAEGTYQLWIVQPYSYISNQVSFTVN